MAHRMSTATRMDRARANGKISRMENGALKRKERSRRDALMVSLLKKGKLPYTQPIMSWVSTKLGKPSTQVTEADIAKLTK
jgi:hypothetical protein